MAEQTVIAQGVRTPEDARVNPYLAGSLAGVFARTAAPIVLIMMVNGLYNVVDAWFLGVFVGADALTAVTLMFPVMMMLIAIATIVSNGFSSVMARMLGASAPPAAVGSAFAGAIALALVLSCVMGLAFFAGGRHLVAFLANGSQVLFGMGYTYMAILVFLAPITFVQMIFTDMLRCEGRVSFMALSSLSAIVLNMVFNYILIAIVGLGVAGSAIGTIAAQACVLSAILVYRATHASTLNFEGLRFRNLAGRWKDYLALGLPPSLGYLGVSLSSAAVIYSLQLWAGGNYAATVGAYGIITRIMIFFYMPLLGLALGFQTVLGNNFGAGNWPRSDTSIRLALLTALLYCVGTEVGFILVADRIGFLFVDDAAIATETGRILPIVVLTFFLFGPLMMIGNYFQATGDVGRSALVNLSRTYLFSLPLTFALPFMFGELGIWIAGPVAEVLLLVLTAVILLRLHRRHGIRWGLFRKSAVRVPSEGSRPD